MSRTFDLKALLSLIDEYWRYPKEHNHLRIGQFIINQIESEDNDYSSVDDIKNFFGDDYNRIYYSNDPNEVYDLLMRYVLRNEEN